MRNDVPRDCDGNGWGDPQCAGGPCPLVGPANCDDYGDFRLRADSPCINAGSNAAEDLPMTDLDGNCRIAGKPLVVDMGAYEFGAGNGACCLDQDCQSGQVCCENACTEPVDSDGDSVPDCRDQCPGEDDRIDENANGRANCAEFMPIPTASAWGLLVLTLLLLIVLKTTSRSLYTMG